jgi:high-affinity K+ transport system ATPase subunit B
MANHTYKRGRSLLYQNNHSTQVAHLLRSATDGVNNASALKQVDIGVASR